MNKQRESIFKAFIAVAVFASILCVLLSANIAEAAGPPFDPQMAKGGMPNCIKNINNYTTDLGTCNAYLTQAWADLETCNTDLDMCEANRVSCLDTVPYPRTGQTTSYAVGDDGDLKMGVAWPTPRFTGNGDGTVTDNLTELIWMKNAGSIGSTYWGDALQSCNTLADGYHGLTDSSIDGDWRLPNVRELQSLIDYGRYNDALPAGHPFINLMWSGYWSSTTYSGISSYAWYANLNNGFMANAAKDRHILNVWCVRGGQSYDAY